MKLNEELNKIPCKNFVTVQCAAFVLHAKLRCASGARALARVKVVLLRCQPHFINYKLCYI